MSIEIHKRLGRKIWVHRIKNTPKKLIPVWGKLFRAPKMRNAWTYPDTNPSSINGADNICMKYDNSRK